MSFTIDILKESEKNNVISLVNSAYRGDASKKGWTTEADIIEGNIRIDMESLNEMLQEPGAVILTCKRNEEICGSVYLKETGSGLYLGMLSVNPRMQGLGIGKKLLDAAEQHALEGKYDHIKMTVIDIRHELIAWYEKHGYVHTGEKLPFDTPAKFGKPTRPFEFIVLKKTS